MLNEFDVFLKDGDKANMTALAENNTYAHETNDWPQTVYYAWVLYGAVSFQVGLYWLQRYYFQNWYGTSDEYLSGLPSSYTNFGLGETINRITLVVMWTVTAVFWVLSNMQMEWFYWFFTIWAKILHYVDIIRLITVQAFKLVGMSTDTKEDYIVSDGTNLDKGANQKVSMMQKLSGTDWYMESFGLTVSFSLYGDLLGISEWARKDQAKCVKTGLCQTTKAKQEVKKKVAAKKKVATKKAKKPVIAKTINIDSDLEPEGMGETKMNKAKKPQNEFLAF